MDSKICYPEIRMNYIKMYISSKRDISDNESKSNSDLWVSRQYKKLSLMMRSYKNHELDTTKMNHKVILVKSYIDTVVLRELEVEHLRVTGLFIPHEFFVIKDDFGISFGVHITKESLEKYVPEDVIDELDFSTFKWNENGLYSILKKSPISKFIGGRYEMI